MLATSPRLFRAVTAAAFTAALISCGVGSDDAPAPPATAPTPGPAPGPTPAPPAALPFKAMPARLNLSVGSQGSLALIGASGALSWTSSDPAVASVDAMGVVTAVARGAATITVTNGARTSAASVQVWQTGGASPDASSESLIAAALGAGRIDAEQALLYRVYARYGDDRLPAAYDGPADPQGSISMRSVAAQLPTLSQATQDLLRPFFIPPIYPESWYGRQLGLSTAQTARSDRVRATATQPPVCSMEYANAAMQVGALLRRSTDHYNLYAFTTQFGQEAAMLDYAASVIEPIHTAIYRLLQREAKGDASEACNGGDGRVDIYLVQLPLREEVSVFDDWAATHGYGRCENTPAFVEIYEPVLRGIFGADPGAGRKVLRNVLAHELTHTIQFGMDRSAPCADYDWIDEGTAQWASDHVFPDDDLEDGVNKLSSHRRSGVHYFKYLRQGHAMSVEKANGYSTYILFQFMARKHGAASIKALFDAWTSHGSVDSLDVALKAVGTNFKDAWPEFGKALWNDVESNVLTDLRDFDHYDLGMANVVSKEPLALAAGRVTLDLLSANGGKLAPRSLAYQRLVFPGEVSPIALTIPFGSLPQAQHLKLTAVKKIGGQWREPEDWTEEFNKFFCRDKTAERIEELVLIVSNSDPDPNAEPAVMPSATPFELSASNVGCWMWQGSATVQTISDDGNLRGTNTARAVDLVFEPPSDYAGGPMVLSVVSGSASGLYTFESTLPACTGNVTGPNRSVAGDATAAALWFNPDLKQPISLVPDRKVSMLTGITLIDSKSVVTCNGNTTVTPAPSTGWPWLIFPLVTNPLDVSADGKSIEANVTIAVPPFRTTHNFKFTAMRE